MTRSNFSRTALLGAAAAGLVALGASASAWAQAATYPQGTDCSAIQNSTNRTDCMQQTNEQRKNGNPGVVAPAPGGSDADGTSTGDPAANPSQNNSGQPNTGTGGTSGSGTNNNGGATQ